MEKKNKKLIIVIITLLCIAVVGVSLFFIFNKRSSNIDDGGLVPEPNINKKEEKLKILDLSSNSRPYAVMINNISTVWGYQSGLQNAYLVYEIIVEGGYTRLMAVFKDKDLDRIGSVRSSRHYFLDYALENDAVYVHFGWSPQAQSDMTKLGVNNINFISYNGYTRDRSLGLATEHTAFTTTSNIMSGIDKYGYRNTSNEKPLLNYSVNSIDLASMDGVKEANNIGINYSSVRSTSFTYDSENKVYNRFQNGKVHKDYVTGVQYTAKNIITYQVDNYNISGDEKGRQTLDNVGSGDGWYISEGYAVPITWEKTSRASKTKYKLLDGSELKVNDGNTFIQIQPSGKTLTIE